MGGGHGFNAAVGDHERPKHRSADLRIGAFSGSHRDAPIRRSALRFMESSATDFPAINFLACLRSLSGNDRSNIAPRTNHTHCPLRQGVVVSARMGKGPVTNLDVLFTSSVAAKTITPVKT